MKCGLKDPQNGHPCGVPSGCIHLLRRGGEPLRHPRTGPGGGGGGRQGAPAITLTGRENKGFLRRWGIGWFRDITRCNGFL